MNRRYFLEIDNWRYVAGALLAGYAAGLFGWQVTHRPLLSAWLTENQLSAAQRLDLAAWLLAGMAAALILWLAASALLAQLGPRPAAVERAEAMSFWLTATARLSGTLLLLPFLPLLAIPGIETGEPALVFCLVIAVSALAAGGARAVLVVRQQLRAPGRARSGDRPEHTASPHVSRFTFHASLLVLLMAVAYALFMGAVTLARHNTFGTYAFDLGIHSQALASIARHGYPLVTLYGPQPVNQFGDHFAPIFYLLTPLSILLRDARALLIVQTLLLASGVAPVYLLARSKLASVTLAVALAAAYLLFPALHGVNTFDFHEIALAVPLLLWSFYCLETGRFRLFGLFLALALFTKEEVALTGVAIGLYILLVQRQPRRGALVMALSAAYFLLVTALIMPALGGGADVGRFEGLAVDGFGGFAGVAMTLFTNPVYTFSYLFLDPDKLLFLAQLLLPLLGIPLLAGAGPWIVALPGFATLLLSSYRPQYLLDTHYSAIVIPSLFFLAVLGLARVERRRRAAALPLAAALLAASLVMNWQFGWLGGKLFHGIPRPTERQRAIAALIDAIPPEASVSTLSRFVPHLASREQIYLYPTVNDAETILFDAALDGDFFPLISRDPRGEAIERLLPLLASGDYGLVGGEDGVLLLQRGADPANNEAALRALGSVTYDAVDLFGSPAMLTVEDPAAASGQARLSPALAEPLAEPVAVVSGPYATVIPGRYRVDYRLRLAEPPAGEGPVAIVDVFSFAAGGQMAQHGISTEEFAARDASAPGGLSMTGTTGSSGPYHTFSLEFQTDRLLNDVEFRVLHTGLGALAVDSVAVKYLGPPGQ
ncbi:MAG: DUF2079 domain-containing protein [Anaerolinea sp.]|nr:DUF2079 domain-containing protein [Anaerolinea sp.]